MSKILVAVDSFKGSLSSLQAADAIEKGLVNSNKFINVVKLPIADGGEGTVEAIVSYKNGELITIEVNDPLFRKVQATYGFIDKGKTAIIEMAAASGIMLLKNEELNPLVTTTYGTGELILDALERRVEKIIIGIGGSATNDGGIGMASALGFKFTDVDGEQIKPVGGDINRIVSIDDSGKDPRIDNTKIIVMCDVINPLYGVNGASQVYAQQKGANLLMVKQLDNNLIYLAKLVEKKYNRSFSFIPGSGAAGGLGFGLLAFLNSELKNGIDFLIDFIGIEEKIKTCDLVITGEGKMDYQTSNNKAAWGIMQLAKKYNKPVYAFTGIVDSHDRHKLLDHFTDIIPIVDENTSKHDSMADTQYYLTKRAEKFFKKLKYC